MAHTKSAKRSIRKNEEYRLRNKAGRSVIKSAQRDLLAAVSRKDASAAAKAYSVYCSALDKAAKRGIITKNTAVRGKARGAANVRSLKAA